MNNRINSLAILRGLQNVTDEQINLEAVKLADERKVCASKIRKVESCADCLHFKECNAKGVIVSDLGAYVAKLDNYHLPRIRRILKRFAGEQDLYVSSCPPYPSEAACGFKWVIKIRLGNNEYKHSRRVLLTGEENNILSLSVLALEDIKKGFKNVEFTKIKI